MRRILVMNLGSTSFKFKLFELEPGENCIATGGVESIGGEGSYFTWVAGQKAGGPCACPTHQDALQLCLDSLTDQGLQVQLDTLDALGYKAVHGGAISGAQRVDEALLSAMERMVPLAPAHNPVYLQMMRSMQALAPQLPQIACFETAFHATIPLERAVYGAPYDWVDKYGVRRYGFHGSSHSYIAWKMAQVAPSARRIISAHLGGSCSLCAILDGQSVANSMGATPQSGVFHNNRVGDFDVFTLPALTAALGSQEAVLQQLASQGGLLGLSGVSRDLRQVEQAAAAGNPQAQLAVDAFVDSIVGYIGMYTAYLGGLDALCFTGGIGTNDASLRAKVVQRLAFMGAALDDEKNLSAGDRCIQKDGSRVSLWVLETNEELMVARQCLRVLNAQQGRERL